METSFRSRVLSIQSHVVHGCVGNSAAVFPMQLNGIDVDSFNILSFSNHTGYALSKGYRVTAEQFEMIADGLTKNKFTTAYNYILSGYVGNVEVMREIGKFVRSILATGASSATTPLYVCDPVCGDLGKLYVSSECVEVYRSELLPLASVALPNGFEASIISGIDVANVATAIKAADWFHEVPRVGVVVIKSFRDAEKDPEGKYIYMLVSEATYASDVDGATPSEERPRLVSCKRSLIAVEYVAGYFTGTGDAFGGLFMSHFSRATFEKQAGNSTYKTIAEAVATAATATLGVLKRTQAYRQATTGHELKDAARGEAEASDFDARELMLVHSADVLMANSIGVSIEELRS